MLKHQWLIAALALNLFKALPLYADVLNPELTQSPPPTPTLESIERPSRTYRPGEAIDYRIRIRWPYLSDQTRMSSPSPKLENLELLTIGQETVSKPGELTTGVEQILTLRLKAGKPGPATLEQFSLLWSQEDGASTSTITIPSL